MDASQYNGEQKVSGLTHCWACHQVADCLEDQSRPEELGAALAGSKIPRMSRLPPAQGQEGFGCRGMKNDLENMVHALAMRL